MSKIARALISVSDKTNVVPFAEALANSGVEILSTGGTAAALRESGIAVKDISEFTGFPEMLDGRVKTLHPRVHAGLLHLRDNAAHVKTMEEHGLEPIDLVCVNLYPFEAVTAKSDATLDDAIENIDIGGPSMIRSAAKNYRYVTVVTEAGDYDRVLQDIRDNDGNTSPDLRMELAQKAFARVAEYNAAIATYLAGWMDPGTPQPFVMAYSRGLRLRYGENPHQDASLYVDTDYPEAAVANAIQLHGKELSYNNYLDGEAALEAVKELSGTPGVAIIKHSNPCGYATGATLAEAFEAAWDGDPVSAFGSVIAVTTTVDLATAERMKGRFVEVLIAPDYEAKALEYLQSKSRDLRVLKLRHPVTKPEGGLALRPIQGGLLVQNRDTDLIGQWLMPTERLIPEEKLPLAEFGVKVCKHIKSNAIALVREYAPGQYALLSMGAGQPNRVDAVRRLALAKAEENIQRLYESSKVYGQAPAEFRASIISGVMLISDAFFPFADSIETAAEAGIRYVVQPGGSKRDEEVIAMCDKFGIAMAVTGMRHFRH